MLDFICIDSVERRGKQSKRNFKMKNCPQWDSKSDKDENNQSNSVNNQWQSGVLCLDNVASTINAAVPTSYISTQESGYHALWLHLRTRTWYVKPILLPGDNKWQQDNNHYCTSD